MTQPLVTVAITLYNYAQYVREAIDSVIDQTYQNLEILVLDNASDDGSADLVRQVQDSRVRLISHPTNIGMVPNFNAGLQEARGDYFMWLSADDAILPTAVADAVALLQARPEVDIFHRPVIEFGADGEWRSMFDEAGYAGARSYSGRNEAAIELTQNHHVWLHTVLFRRDLLIGVGGMDEEFGAAADWELFVRLALRGCRFAFEARPAALFRIHGGGRSGTNTHIASGDQLAALLKLVIAHVRPENEAHFAGWAAELATNLSVKHALFRRHADPAQVSEIEESLAQTLDRAIQAIESVPAISGETLAGRPLISVVIPFSGRAGNLRRALLRLVAQTYSRWEAIVVADGDIDPTPVAAAVDRVGRIRVASTRSRRGPTWARALGLRCARGEVITYLSEDDVLDPGHLAALAAAFTDPRTQAYVGGIRIAMDRAGGYVTDRAHRMPSGAAAGSAAFQSVSHRRSLPLPHHSQSHQPTYPEDVRPLVDAITGGLS